MIRSSKQARIGDHGRSRAYLHWYDTVPIPRNIHRPMTIRMVLSLAMCLFGYAVSPAMAEALSTRDILYLNKFGKNISSISWCSDQALTFVDAESPQTAGQDTAKRPIRTINMLSLASGDIRSLLVYPDARIRADCIRGGDFLYVSGFASLAYRPGNLPVAEAGVTRSFNHLVELLRADTVARRPATIDIRTGGAALNGPVLTDANGNVYGRSSGLEIELKDVNLAALAPYQKERLTYKIRKDEFDFVVFSVDGNRLGPRDPKINVYGLSTPQIGGRNVGSYQCSAPRPGCTIDATAKTQIYYTSSLYAISKEPGPDGSLAARDALYTVVPGEKPLLQRWPIVKASASRFPYELAVVDVALDEQRCLVLLEPRRGLASSRVAGRLRLDLLIADCEVKDGRLEYSEPHILGRKQGSFIFPKLSLKGDAVVVADVHDISSQEEDQLELERAENARARVCVRLFRGGSAAALQRINSLCALADRLDFDPVIVSPNAKFIVFNARDNPLIVGRDYRSNGGEPDWLTNEIHD